MIESERTVALRTTLAADGYEIDVAQAGERISVTITATEQACADCLVPKDLMRGILSQTLGVDSGLIDLTYPSDRLERFSAYVSQDQPAVSCRPRGKPAAPAPAARRQE